MELEESSIFFSSRKITNVKQFSGQKEPFDKSSVWFWKQSEVGALLTILTSGHTPRHHLLLLCRGRSSLHFFFFFFLLYAPLVLVSPA